jgi:hypothetical protein
MVKSVLHCRLKGRRIGPSEQKGGSVNPQQQAERLTEHLRQAIGRADVDLAQLSRGVLGRTPDYLSKTLRGERLFRVGDLFRLLAAIEVAPEDFFAELYDLYRADEVGAEVAPGIFEGKIRRFVEQVARRAALEVAAGRARGGRVATAKAGSPESRGGLGIGGRRAISRRKPGRAG